jgi:hypothetical protein
MAANVYGLHQFADDVGPLPLKYLDDSFSALNIAINTLSTYSNFYADGGTTNAYTVQTPNTQYASLTDGLQVIVRIANTNTAASTLNLNGLGAMPILNPDGSEMQAGQLAAGALINFMYNAQRQAWQIPYASGIFTAPFSVNDANGQHLIWANAAGQVGMVTWPTGNSLILEPDGGGALGCPPSQLMWDNAGNWTFGGSSVIHGFKAVADFFVYNPAEMTDAGAFFQVWADGHGYLGPNPHQQGMNWTTEGSYFFAPKLGNAAPTVNISCNPGESGFLVGINEGAAVTPPPINVQQDMVRIHAPASTLPAGSAVLEVGIPEASTSRTTPQYVASFSDQASPPVGNSNGVWIAAGTNANDSAFNVEPAWSRYGPFFFIRGDGSGGLGKGGLVDMPVSSKMIWDSNIHFSFEGDAQFPLDILTNVQITNAQTGQALMFNGTEWVNSSPSDVDLGALANLTDVSLTNPVAGNLLVWNGTAWINQAAAGVISVVISQAGPSSAAGVILTPNPITDMGTIALDWTQVAGTQRANTFTQPQTFSGDVTFTGNVTGGGITSLTKAAGINFWTPAMALVPVLSGAGVIGVDWNDVAGVARPNTFSIGANIFNTDFRVNKSGGTPVFQTVSSDGSGSIGPSPNNLSWDAAGNFTLNGTATLPGGGGGGSLTPPVLLSADVATVFKVQAPQNPQTLQWLAEFVGAPVFPGVYNGVHIVAGDNSMRAALLVESANAPYGQLFRIGGQGDVSLGRSTGTFTGDGNGNWNFAFSGAPYGLSVSRSPSAGWIGPSAANCLSWNSAGNFSLLGTATLPAPTGLPTLAGNQAWTGSNNFVPGLNVGQFQTNSTGIAVYGPIRSQGFAQYSGGNYTIDLRQGSFWYIDLGMAEADGLYMPTIYITGVFNADYSSFKVVAWQGGPDGNIVNDWNWSSDGGGMGWLNGVKPGVPMGMGNRTLIEITIVGVVLYGVYWGGISGF